MPFDGQGGYSAPVNSWNPAVSQTVIDPADWNSTQSDYETALSNVICKDGQTNPTANLPMAGFKHTGVNTNSGVGSRSEYVSGATFQDGAPLDAGSTGGTSTAYTASLTPAITAYADKQCFRVKFDQACGVDPTINFNSVGAKKIYKNTAGSAAQLEANDVLADQIWHLRYDSSLDGGAGGFLLLNYVAEFSISGLTVENTVDYYNDFLPFYDTSATTNRKVRPEYLLGLMRGSIYGLTLSNNGTDANNDIDIAIGQAVDNTNFALMVLASPLTKRLDANWAVGTNEGGLDTGSKANSTWYHVWLIQRSDTGVVDALFSTSATSPTMPTDYDRKRRIGAIVTDGSGNIWPFVQVGRNRFDWVVEITDWDVTNPGTSAVNRTVTAPPNTIARLVIGIINGTTNNNPYRVWETSKADAAPTVVTADVVSPFSSTASWARMEKEVVVDASSQVRTRIATSGANDRILGRCLGFIDPEL